MGKTSAGILLYRFKGKEIQFFLVHPGGPFWAGKDSKSWSVPKGEFKEEDPFDAAKREFEEETGSIVSGDFIKLTPVRLSSGKTVFCYGVEGNIDSTQVKSNTFEIEWPPKSGKKQSFPEIDRGGWFNADEASEKIIAAQAPLIDELTEILFSRHYRSEQTI
jgi:predicted NUDIX family NTP pyrophosphohydrolase